MDKCAILARENSKHKERLKMHGYFWNPLKLLKEVKEYDGGQLQIESTEKSGGLTTHKMFRGEIKKSDVIIAPKKREITVEFNWLCYKQFDFTGTKTQSELMLISNKHPWIKQPPRCNGPIIIGYTTYYRQRDEERVKIWSNLGETIHLFKPNDHTNLIQSDENKFSSYQVVNYRKLLLSLCYTIVINSKKGKK